MGGAIEETLTIAPPLPPCRVDMRLTAAPAHSIEPIDVDAHHPLEAGGAHLVDACLDVDDAGIVDQRIERAEAPIDRVEHRMMSASLPTSACTANASPPPDTISSTTALAAAAFDA